MVNKTESESTTLLKNLANQYLYKDIFELEEIRKPDLLLKMLQLISFQEIILMSLFYKITCFYELTGVALQAVLTSQTTLNRIGIRTMLCV